MPVKGKKKYPFFSGKGYFFLSSLSTDTQEPLKSRKTHKIMMKMDTK